MSGRKLKTQGHRRRNEKMTTARDEDTQTNFGMISYDFEEQDEHLMVTTADGTQRLPYSSVAHQ